nr:DUF4365 domain-containing protein [uncultured Pseudodesulfovibrio sp.]
MYETHQKEQFSLAYISAVAAKTGCNITRWAVDDDSVDCSLKYKMPGYPQVDMQVKCTQNLTDSDDCFKFVLTSIKNYNDLRDDNLCVSKILVVVGVPDNLDDWLEQDQEGLLLRRCAYWVNLKGEPATTNKTAITIDIPKENMFSPDALMSIMTTIAAERAA